MKEPLTPNEVKSYINNHAKTDFYIDYFNEMLTQGLTEFVEPDELYYSVGSGSAQKDQLLAKVGLARAIEKFQKAGWTIKESVATDKFNEGRVTYTFIRGNDNDD